MEATGLGQIINNWFIFFPSWPQRRLDEDDVDPQKLASSRPADPRNVILPKVTAGAQSDGIKSRRKIGFFL